MTTENARPQFRSFVTSWLPWVLGAIMLIVYLATLNTTMTPASWGELSGLAGWRPGAQVFGLIAFMVTLPFRWLSPNSMPFALNLLAAICGSLILVLLARSVALLPRDRTHEQRRREQNEFSILSIRNAWVPPVMAVIVCGLELSFWSNSTEATGDLFNLLLFAYVIRCLLEYRVDQRESWLVRFALVYGLGMANDYSFIGFFPGFLAALIWIRGLSFFRIKFLGKMLLCLLIGLVFIFVMPAVDTFSHATSTGFWQQLGHTLAMEKNVLAHYPRDVVLLLSLTSLIPIVLISIRWASYFGDNSPTGILIANLTLHVIQGFFLLACLWVALDAPISPRHKGMGISFLTFYYLGALSIGYFTGYFLLVFGTRVSRGHSAPEPLEKFVDILVIACVWILLIAMPVILIVRNLPFLRSEKKIYRSYDKYFDQIAQSLPAKGAVVFSDDGFRLTYLNATLHRRGKQADYMLVDTGLLDKNYDYLGFLKKSNPQFEVNYDWTNTPPNVSHDLGLIQLLGHFSQSHDLYYLQASFGYFFEAYYQQQQGLVYRLQTYPEKIWDAPPVTPEQVADNQKFWKTTSDDILGSLSTAINEPQSPSTPGLWDQFMDRLHLTPEHSPYIYPLGGYYSQALNNWGVELQRSKYIPESAACFEQALKLNPGNISAGVNRELNEFLRLGKEPGVKPPKELEEKVNQHGGWQDLLRVDGLCDEPNFRDELASIFIQGGNIRQAIQQYHRIREISPSSIGVQLQLAQLLIYIQSYTNAYTSLIPHYTEGYPEAMTLTKNVLKLVPDQPMALFLKSVILMQDKDYKQALEPMDRLLAQQTNNYAALLNRAIAHYKLEDLSAAKADYEGVAHGAPKAYQAYFGLAEIAYQQKDKADAIKNYELYLTNAPPNTEEVKAVMVRLKELQASPP